MKPSLVPAPVRQWYVTASHRAPMSAEDALTDSPYGTAHLRKLGAPRTGCGVPALNWPIFWDHAMEDAADLCRECRWAAVSGR